ncbi:hypothetical protein BJV77DRAFT_966034 [Russula vinacea]|nr:hypothetical protein BJV77DRAFT_966034 [Russula vinacea]
MTSEQVIPPIMALRSIGLDFANWGRGDDLKKETDARGGVRVPDSGRLEDDMVILDPDNLLKYLHASDIEFPSDIAHSHRGLSIDDFCSRANDIAQTIKVRHEHRLLYFLNGDLLVFKDMGNKTPNRHVTGTKCRPDITAAFEKDWITDDYTDWALIRLAGERASEGKSREIQRKNAVIRCSTGCTRIPTGAENRRTGAEETEWSGRQRRESRRNSTPNQIRAETPGMHQTKPHLEAVRVPRSGGGAGTPGACRTRTEVRAALGSTGTAT